MKSILIFWSFSAFLSLSSCRRVNFLNRCPHDVWVSPFTSKDGPMLSPGIVKLTLGQNIDYQIPDAGWEGRFWPKTGCDNNGANCEVGQSIDPCPPTGCLPPAETKVEFTFLPLGDPRDSYYDVSLVDGYSLATTIVPDKSGGSCVPTSCDLSLDRCPTDENDVGDLRMMNNGRTVACLSPCKKWNSVEPYGLNKPEIDQPGYQLCCPHNRTVECNQGIIKNAKYVELVHQVCPTAYSFSYDDKAGNHNCPNDVNFDVSFC